MINVFGRLGGFGHCVSRSVILQHTIQPVSFIYRTSATQTIKPPNRGRRANRHRNELYRKARGPIRNLKLDLYDFEFDRRHYNDQVTPEEMRERMKKMGVAPMSQYQEKPTYISSTGTIIDQYVPAEGDGKASIISLTGTKQVASKVQGKGKTMSSVRKIRKYEDEFDPKEWVEQAEDIYKKAHEALADNDEDLLHKYVTEKCFPEMMYMAKRKTIRWNYIKSIEPPRVVHARHADIITKDNMFGQLTVRFHSQQTLAVYDRFGRLIHGNENVVKDVLEYCVFEKHLSNLYGTWRLHGKLIPDWKPKNENYGVLTHRVMPEKAEKSEETEADETAEDSDHKKDNDNESDDKVTLYDRFGKILGKN